MLEISLSVLGIFISILFFVVGYRQTIGARKERITACNADIQKILLRRIVLETYQPTQIDVARLSEGKARDFRVSLDDILSEGQILNGVYTKVVESDLIPTEQREAAVNRIIPALLETEKLLTEEEETGGTDAVRLRRRSRTVLFVIALVASALGGLLPALPSLVNLDTTYPALFRTMSFTVLASLLIITLIIIINRVRSSQEVVLTKGTEVDDYIRFERDVAMVFKRSGFSVSPPPGRGGGDFIADKQGRRLLVEVKAWSRPIPIRMVADLGNRLARIANELENAEAMIVTKSLIVDGANLFEGNQVHLVTFRQLRSYLATLFDGSSAE